MNDYRITTYDNPWNPYSHYDEWLSHDNEFGYRTSERLARLATTTNKLSDDLIAYQTDSAIDTLISLHPTLYKKVPKPA